MSFTEYDKQWCKGILDYLTKWGIAAPFLKPVTEKEAPTYTQKIQHPMDLSTMKKKLTQSEYSSVNAFMDDIYLICDNAVEFNGINSMYAFIAKDIRTWAEKQFKEKSSSAEEEWTKKLKNIIEQLNEHIKNIPPSTNTESVTA